MLLERLTILFTTNSYKMESIGMKLKLMVFQNGKWKTINQTVSLVLDSLQVIIIIIPSLLIWAVFAISNYNQVEDRI